jgi:hypothetical protein
MANRLSSYPISFVVEEMLTPTLPRVDLNESLVFKKTAEAVRLKLDRLRRKLDKAVEILKEAETAIKDSIAEPGELLKEARDLTLEIERLKKSLFGDPIKDERFVESVPTPAMRLMASQQGFLPSNHGPTKTHRQQLDIASREIEAATPKVELSAVQQVNSFRTKLEALGIEITAHELP